MNIRAHWQFYKGLLPFIAASIFLGVMAFGIPFGFVIFCSFGLAIGFLGFSVFRKEEYYFYYNLGLTKWKLLKVSFIINLLLGTVVFSLLFSFFYFVFERVTII